MQATIKIINANNSMYGADIGGEGDYVVFELLDFKEPKMGDVVAYENFYNMGAVTFKNITQGYDIDVYIEHISDMKLAKEQCTF
jgi:predicted amino acid racemase